MSSNNKVAGLSSPTKAKRLYLTINKLMELIENEIHKNTNNELFYIFEFMDNMNNRTFANYRNVHAHLFA